MFLFHKFHPGLFGATLPWYSAEEYRKLILSMKNCLVPLLYSRDEDSGSITINKEGNPVVNYWPSERDRQKMVDVRIQVGLGDVVSLDLQNSSAS